MLVAPGRAAESRARESRVRFLRTQRAHKLLVLETVGTTTQVTTLRNGPTTTRGGQRRDDSTYNDACSFSRGRFCRPCSSPHELDQRNRVECHSPPPWRAPHPARALLVSGVRGAKRVSTELSSIDNKIAPRDPTRLCVNESRCATRSLEAVHSRGATAFDRGGMVAAGGGRI